MSSFDDKVGQIVEFLRPRNVVLFVGSGVSVDAHLPGWDTLDSKLRRALEAKGIGTAELNVFTMADLAKRHLGNQYFRLLREAFRDPMREPGELDEILATLKGYFRFVVTSNYDKLLESAFRTVRLGIDPPVTTDLGVAMSLSRDVKVGEPFIYKINGDIDDQESIILGQEDYARKDYAAIFAFLANSKTFYVGYGFRDPILDHYRTQVSSLASSWRRDTLVMLKGGPPASTLLAAGYEVTAFNDFEEQRRILREVAARLVENPYRRVHDMVLKPSATLVSSEMFGRVRDSVRSVAGQMLVLHESWEFGWDVDDFKFERIGPHLLPAAAAQIAGAAANEVERPWWGKLAYMGITLPLTERQGAIRAAGTSYRQYTALWRQLDAPGLVAGSTIRARWWEHDLKRQFEDSDLPHNVCMHLAVITRDGSLLLTRKSEKVHFERKRWCPSMEEQVSDGAGEATDDEVAAQLRKFGAPKPVDESPRATCLRGLLEELGIPAAWVVSIRLYAIATDWNYSDAVPVGVALLDVDASAVSARFGGEDLGEFQVDPKRRLQYAWSPVRVDSVIELLSSDSFAPTAEMLGEWHVSARLRLFAVMAWMVQRKLTTWSEWEAALLA